MNIRNKRLGHHDVTWSSHPPLASVILSKMSDVIRKSTRLLTSIKVGAPALEPYFVNLVIKRNAGEKHVQIQRKGRRRLSHNHELPNDGAQRRNSKWKAASRRPHSEQRNLRRSKDIRQAECQTMSISIPYCVPSYQVRRSRCP